MDELSYYLGLDAWGALAIVVSTTLLYLAFAAILSRYGQRLFASPSSLDLAIVTVLGAVVGRAILGQVPTLSGGLLALATLFLIEAFAGRLRRGRRPAEDDDRYRAIAVLVNGRVDSGALHRHKVAEPTLWAALREAGLRAPGEAALVVLEASGRFSVLRAGQPVDPAMLTGVRHADEVRRQLATPGS